MKQKIKLKIIRCIMYLFNKIYGIDTRKIVFSSFGGKLYSDNPRAISEAVHRASGGFEIVWIFNNPESKDHIVPKYIKVVSSGTIQAYKELATSKYWVDNVCKPLHYYKSKNQFYIQTWHGDRGFKKILHDSTFKDENFELFESEFCDLAISGSDYGDNQYRSGFQYNGDIFKKGYPRNDILVKNSAETVKEIKASLKLNQESNYVLYAPTLRRKTVGKTINYSDLNINVVKLVHNLEQATSKRWECLIRLHSAIEGIAELPDTKLIQDITNYEEMSHLLLISDMLITDYSSCSGDYALLHRPIILYHGDVARYHNEERTFYFQIEDSPYIVAHSEDELNEVILKFDSIDFVNNCKNILNFYGTHESGNSSGKLAELIASEKGLIE